MADMYSMVRKTEKKPKKPWVLPVILAGAIIALVVTGILIYGPLMHHRDFMDCLSSVSEDTSFVGEHGDLKCYYGDQILKIRKENAYELYKKLFVGERIEFEKQSPEGDCIRLEYGTGSVMRLWQYEYTEGRRDGVFVEYTDPSGKQTRFRTNQVSFKNLTGVLKPENNTNWNK